MILNQQRQVKISIGELEKFSRKLRRLLRIPANALTICLVTNEEIAKWNRAYRGKNRPTDVLSFAADEPHSQRRTRRLPGKRNSFALRAASAPPFGTRFRRRNAHPSPARNSSSDGIRPRNRPGSNGPAGNESSPPSRFGIIMSGQFTFKRSSMPGRNRRPARAAAPAVAMSERL